MLNLPIYKAILNKVNDGIFAISIVDEPATENNFEFFAKAEEIQKYAVQDESEQLITGVIMLADTPIIRCNGDFKYYITYSRETLKEMAEKMLAEGMQNNVDFQHNGRYVDGIKMVELYIKDSTKGIVPNFLENVPDGSLIATYHVEDKEVFEAIKESGFKGFSLAGCFSYEEQFKANNNSNKNNFKMKFSKIIKQVFMSFASIDTDKGTISYAGDGELEVGMEVYVEGEDGEHTPVEDGEYIADGKVIVVADSKVAEIKEVEAEPAAEEPAEEPEATEEMEDEEPAEEPVEEPADDLKAELEALKAEVEALKAALEEVKASVAEIAQKPAVEPIVEEFEASKSKTKPLNIYAR